MTINVVLPLCGNLGLFYSVSNLFFPIFILSCLFSSSVSLFYFILPVPMSKCCGQQQVKSAEFHIIYSHTEWNLFSLLFDNSAKFRKWSFVKLNSKLHKIMPLSISLWNASTDPKSLTAFEIKISALYWPKLLAPFFLVSFFFFHLWVGFVGQSPD